MEDDSFPPGLKAELSDIELQILRDKKEKLEKRLRDRPISAPMRLIIEATIASIDKTIAENSDS